MRGRWLATGLVAGLFLTASPVVAGDGDPKIDRLKRRVNFLSNKIIALEQQASTTSQRVGALETWRAGAEPIVAAAPDRLTMLEQKAFLLNPSGQYTGQISANQVDTPSGCEGDDAFWLSSFGQGLTCA